MKKTSIKVGILCYSLFGGGAERNAINTTIYLKKRKIPCDLILFKNKIEYSNEYKKYYSYLSIKHISRLQNSVALFLKPFFYLFFLISLIRTVKRERYSVLIGSIEYDPFYLTVLLGKILRIKSILIVGNNIPLDFLKFNFFKRKILYLLFRFSFIYASSIICVSYGLSWEIKHYFCLHSSKITTIYNGLNAQLLRQKAPTKDKGSGINIVFMGRLVEQKGVRHLINSFKTVSKHIPNSTLTIIGKGPLKRQLEQQVKRLSLKNKVVFLGFLEGQQYTLLKTMDLFVFPSLYEGFGNVIIEAMYCGLPVISTNCPYGPSEILGLKQTELHTYRYTKWGVLTPYIKHFDTNREIKAKENMMAQAIISLLNNHKAINQYRLLAKKRAQYFSLNQMGSKILAEIVKIS